MKYLLFAFFSIALICFALDWAHMVYHLAGSPELRSYPGAPAKFALKTAALFLPLSFIFIRQLRSLWLVLFLMICFVSSEVPTASAASRACRNAKDLLQKSGVSRDANENWLGHVKVKSPHGSFPEEMDKITWWGEFQPFELWDNPKFQAVWINPRGQQAAVQNFQGKKCRLAKTSIKSEDQPRGMHEPGIWQVAVTCDDILIDQQSFAVLSSQPSGVDPADGQHKNEAVMIWAEDALKD